MAWAWSQDVPNGASKMALLCIASQGVVDEDAISTLGCMSMRLTREAIATLLEARLISKLPGGYRVAPAIHRETGDTATDITRKYWARVTPRPMNRGGFAAIRAIVKKALDTGWDNQSVYDALFECPTVTTAALELALRRRVQQTTGTNSLARPVVPVRPHCDTCRGSTWVDAPDGQVARCPDCWDPRY